MEAVMRRCEPRTTSGCSAAAGSWLLLNLGDAGASVPVSGVVAVGTRSERDGEALDGTPAVERARARSCASP